MTRFVRAVTLLGKRQINRTLRPALKAAILSAFNPGNQEAVNGDGKGSAKTAAQKRRAMA